MSIFRNIKDVDISDPSSYLGKVFLTFDIDWASDGVLEYCLDIVESAKVKATWFVTHQTPLLERIRSNPLFEMGIHPNFLPLLEGDFKYGKHYTEVLDYYLKIVPEAKSIRSHCLAYSSRVGIEAKKRGLEFDCNYCIPFMALGGGYEQKLHPYRNWDHLIRVPYYWADDVACNYDKKIRMKDMMDSVGYIHVAFHPIHVFLNTESCERYEKAKSFSHDLQFLESQRGQSPIGSQAILKEILSL